jgi:hypothetical protein
LRLAACPADALLEATSRSRGTVQCTRIGRSKVMARSPWCGERRETEGKAATPPPPPLGRWRWDHRLGSCLVGSRYRYPSRLCVEGRSEDDLAFSVFYIETRCAEWYEYKLAPHSGLHDLGVALTASAAWGLLVSRNRSIEITRPRGTPTCKPPRRVSWPVRLCLLGPFPTPGRGPHTRQSHQGNLGCIARRLFQAPGSQLHLAPRRNTIESSTVRYTVSTCM